MGTGRLILAGLIFCRIQLGMAQTWDERPAATYDAEYSQEFNYTAGWDRFTFYDQWNTLETANFNASDISTGALQFQWIPKRIICSKRKYIQPYVFEADMDYSVGSNRGGVVIRIAAFSDNIQEPESDPGFNREGIAFYPAVDGLSMIVQFSEQDKGYGSGMVFSRILVPKPASVASLLQRGTLRIEDYGSGIYLFYNGSPYIRIELNGKTGDLYTSGTVYDANMQVMGSFSGMEVEEYGHVAVGQRDAMIRLYRASVRYNDVREVFNPADTVIFESPYRDLYADTWVATDALGRVMPDYDQVGPPKNDKRRVVGIFYITWHLQQHHTNFPAPFSADVTKILEADPGARLDAYHPLWNYPSYSYHWGEPEMGYFLSQDEWVIRKDMAMLANAGVDVLIMDVTNAVRYWDEWEVLFTTMQKMEAEGNKVPKICFWAFNGPVITVVQDLYDYFYKRERFKDLWFYWDGKPLLLYRENPDLVKDTHPNPNYDPDAVTNPNNPNYGNPDYTREFYNDYTQEVKDFFTLRNMWWGYYEWEGERYIGTEDNWSFGYDLGDSRVKALTPQQLIATHQGINEQASVNPAQHPSSLVGKSWSRATGEPELDEYDLPEPTYVPWLGQTVENPEGYGIYFQERWEETLLTDPDFIYINDWNEWSAGKFHDGAVNPFMRRNSQYYFVDQYNAEFNRGIQPMKEGYTDNYYMQMAQNIRRYKGVRQPVIHTGITTIQIDNDFSDWASVTHEFRDAIGDTRHRKHNGYGGLEYVNTTGRNDIISSRVAYDNDHLYFYVKTVRDLTFHDDPNWMLLFLDIDRNKQTGWEGYDYIINKGVNASNQTTLKQWNGMDWANARVVTFAYSGSEMEISVPRSFLNLEEGTPSFYFKWADNPQHLENISAFFTDGESAPDRRFNYNYSTTGLPTGEQSPFKELDIPGVVEFEDFDNGGVGVAYADAVVGNSGGVYRTDESVDIREKSSQEYYIADILSKEWLEYTVNVKGSGLYTATIHYSASADNQAVSLFMDGRNMSTVTFPKTGSENDWSTVETEVRINAGTQIFRLFVDQVSGGLQLDKIVFAPKSLVEPDDGTGLLRTLYNGSTSGNSWFMEPLCSEVDSVVDHVWAVGESPGCGARSSYWNARWRGWLEPHFTETYTIGLTVNDMGRVWINDVLVVNAWTDNDANKTHVGTITLSANEKVPVRIDYANITGEGTIRLEWESSSQVKEVIPQSQLFPETDNPPGNATKPVIFPNPARSILYIESASSSNLAVYNLYGHKVYAQSIESDSHNVNVSNWNPGVYIVQITDAGMVFQQKLLVDK